MWDEKAGPTVSSVIIPKMFYLIDASSQGKYDSSTQNICSGLQSFGTALDHLQAVPTKREGLSCSKCFGMPFRFSSLEEWNSIHSSKEWNFQTTFGDLCI